MHSTGQVLLLVDAAGKASAKRPVSVTELESLGWHVLVAYDQVEAEQYYIHENPDTVLIDVAFPNEEGLQLLVAFQRHFPDSDVILVVPSEDADVGPAAFCAGASDICVRPITSKNIEIVMQRTQHRLHMRQALTASEARVQQRNQELALLNRAGQVFNSTLDLNQVIVTVLEEVRALLDVVATSIWLIDQVTTELICCQATGPKSEVVRGWRLPPTEGLVGWVASHGQSLIVSDIRADARHFEEVDQQTGLDLHAMLSVPLQVKERVIGVLQVMDAQIDRFDRRDLALLEALGASAAVAIENARLYEQTRREIVERQHAELKLQEAERRFHTLLDNVKLIAVGLDLEGRVTYANPHLLTLTGYTLEQTINQPWFETFVPEPEQSELAQVFHEILTKNMYAHRESSIVTKTGEKRLIAWNNTLLLNESQQPIGTMSIGEDVTERRQAEEALRLYAERLEILHKIDQDILAARSLPNIAQAALNNIQHLVPCLRSGVTLLNETNDEMVLLAVNVCYESQLKEGARFPADPSDDRFCELQQGRLVKSEIEPSRGGDFKTLVAEGVRFYASAPLISRGKLIGALNLAFSSLDQFMPEHEKIVMEVAEQLAIAIQQARLLEEVQHYAKELEQIIADRTRELAVLYEVATVASQSQDLDLTLARSLERVLAVTHNQEGAIHLVDEANTFHLAAQQGFSSQVLARVADLPAVQTPWAWVIENAEPIIISDITSDPRGDMIARILTDRTYLGVPMWSSGRVVGVLSIFSQTMQMQLTVEELSLLTSVADEIGICVESARLRELAEQAAVLGERTRLARELHDSVTQLLYSINLFVKSGRNAYNLGNYDEVRYCLVELGKSTQQAMKEMRLLVHELRPPILEQEGLIGALQRRLDAVEGRAGVQTQLLTNKILELPGWVEEELYYIALEALNNALKHAKATSVTVRIDAHDTCLKLIIADNGQGFMSDDLKDSGGLGLVGMRERVEKLQGKLSIVAKPGNGAQVLVTIPNAIICRECK